MQDQTTHPPHRISCLSIGGTDTDAGKTIVTAALARAATASGRRVLVIKAVQTGCEPEDRGENLVSPDCAVYRDAAPGAATRVIVRFRAACSPHLAALAEGRTLTARDLAAKIGRAVREWAAEAEDGTRPGRRKLVLLEGAGGLLTPLGASESLVDLLQLLAWPVLLVAANRLGAVNHALLSLEALRARKLACPGFVMVETRSAPDELERSIRRDNPRIASTLSQSACLAELPYMPDLRAKDCSRREKAWDRAAQALFPVLNDQDSELAPSFPSAARNASPDALLHFDRTHLWHPYTSALRPIRTWEAVGAAGTRIRLRDGRELVDGMASWWCAIHGYRHPRLLQALHAQADTMPHVMFGGLTHAPAADLGRRLLDMAPAGDHVFFADSGSVAVEAALKMALQYWQAAGKTRRTRILTVRGGYHGDTLGAMSVCDPEQGMHALFSGILPRQLFAPRPTCRFDAPYDSGPERAFAEILAAHADSVAAVLLEPIVQGAGGMWFYHPNFLRGVHALCKRHGCLLILDEIATGFGRTGKLFACEHADVTPDILCLGKGLSGGVMTLAATLATRDVAEGISRDGGVFMHGPTFMANPLSCAVAEASLELIARGTWRMDVARVETGLRHGLAPCAALPGVTDVRVLGAIGVVEMERPVNVERLQAFFVEQGVWIRPFGRLIYLMPPYVATEDDIAVLSGAICRAVLQEAWC